jgi:hypothetical protein
LFLESLAALRAYGHRCVVIAPDHLLCACSNKVVALLCRSPILYSAIPF